MTFNTFIITITAFFVLISTNIQAKISIVKIPKPLKGSYFYEIKKIERNAENLKIELQRVDFLKDEWVHANVPIAKSCEASKIAFEDGVTKKSDLHDLGSCQGYPAQPDGYYVHTRKEPLATASIDDISNLKIYYTAKNGNYVLMKVSAEDFEKKYQQNPSLVYSIILKDNHVSQLREQYVP